ncbi:putative bifunctional diguanylate cyclase/phosphodiesterase [Deinococcus hopiensis]|nr:EAL domain-containing protein [Deinococcus hopiensis]
MQTARRSPLLLTLGLLAFSGLLHSAWLAFGWGGREWREWYSDLHYLLVVGLFMAVTAQVGRDSSGPLRPAFRWLLVMAVIRFAAEGTWTYLELILKVPPFPSLADTLYFLAYLAQGVALLRLAQVPLRALSTARLALDSLTVVGAVGVFSWQLFLARVATNAAEPLLNRLVTLMYPALDLALLSLLLLVVFRRQRLRTYEGLFAAGLLLNIVGDYLFAYLSTTGAYSTGQPVDALWAWSFVLEGFGVALAARAPAGEEREVPRWQAQLSTFSPYLALLGSFSLLIRLEGVQTPEVQGVLWGTAAVTALVVARQTVMLTDNARLNRVLSAREAELAHLAHHDPLTGLPNRRALTAALDAKIAQTGPAGRLALLFADLDGFKNINDTQGHAAGDAALREIAARLAAQTPSGGLAARLSGDEFALLLPGVPHEDGAWEAGKQLAQAITVPLALEGTRFTVGVSVGVALWPDHARSASELLSAADTAMYGVKTAGKNGVKVFRPEMRAATRRRQDIERLLRDAPERGELRLHYQAQGSLGGEPHGTEALLRWTSPEMGEVSPAEFVPVAEETGLIVSVGGWALGEACRQVAVWRAQDLALRVTVNVSPAQLAHPDFGQWVEKALRSAGLPGHALELELSALPSLPDLARFVRPLEVLTAKGVRLSLGGVGAGPLDLTHLLPLPLMALKVDRRVVAALARPGTPKTEDDAGATQLLRATVALARSLGLSVVAQGVEQEWQRRRVQALGADAYQGHLLARPLPAGEFEDWWRSNKVSG